MQNLCKVELLYGKLLCKTKAINQQPVRYTRKPRWLPKAPTKMFRVPVRPQISPDENKELFRLYTNYRTTMKSIQEQLEYELETSYTGQEVLQEIANKEEVLWAKCMDVNDNWNAEVATEREQRLAKEREDRREEILAQLIEKEEDKKKKLEAVEEIIRLEKEKSKTYITVENIDEAIEKALDNVVDHKYALDLAGNIFKGNDPNEPTTGTMSFQTLGVQSIN
ncbi:probable 28S ribosomal protein S26, mitochondrial [Acyrthosiphon pisum]|uniref:Small ribosomal subunit protein mS26 n=1 Tax=Acyrthosiphon pisum TaxID=7029 RepID=C4WSV9_ACYPI|nr:probable 28S ribosomal protein S26, mitochondrial [Acyrthosiphon pisum]BAH70979.1 ACYPI009963 [Acyrthosiphon pisum]|eukprot:NP_001280367.1 probable 28S ribosomal protein S26, mitochondrial [Acyrthosiphon pisum]